MAFCRAVPPLRLHLCSHCLLYSMKGLNNFKTISSKLSQYWVHWYAPVTIPAHLVIGSYCPLQPLHSLQVLGSDQHLSLGSLCPLPLSSPCHANYLGIHVFSLSPLSCLSFSFSVSPCLSPRSLSHSSLRLLPSLPRPYFFPCPPLATNSLKATSGSACPSVMNYHPVL